VPEPNTWREIVDALKDRPERRFAVQLYGRPHPELIDALRAKGAEVTPVSVYQYALPDDVTPLREAAGRLARGEFDAVLFTTSQQVVHLLDIARETGQESDVAGALKSTFVASVGPTTSETLREHGIEPALEPYHPKLGFLVKETAERFS
jgi:uroporphyrinogen-III synthase